MMSYGVFARYYDRLTQNIDYNALADYYDGLLTKQGNGGRLVVDLACGTGSLAFGLTQKGYEVIGVDASQDMLALAVNKNYEHNISNMYLCQTMQTLDLYGTVDAVICSLDSINHLSSIEDVAQTFDRVSLFLNTGGLFIFDVNTEYKHEKVLSNSTFVYDYDDLYCVWQNCFDKKDKSVEISLDFFARQGNSCYQRYHEEFMEYYYSQEQLVSALNKAGLEVIAQYNDFTLNPVLKQSQREVYLCKKRENIADGKDC